MKFNLNDYVRVRLTDKGRKVLRDMGLSEETDRFGYSDWQLWVLMDIFGPHIGMGVDLPFETTIEFDTKETPNGS